MHFIHNMLSPKINPVQYHEIPNQPKNTERALKAGSAWSRKAEIGNKISLFETTDDSVKNAIDEKLSEIENLMKLGTHITTNAHLKVRLAPNKKMPTQVRHLYTKNLTPGSSLSR